MPDWFKTGGNIREQHSNIAAGVAKEYEKKTDGHYIHALVVDPVSVKKVDTGVLKGFSIGIKSPRVIRDTKAANGRIVDGQIVEISLVDRPANPNCQLVLAKAASGADTLIQVEDLIEKKDKPDYESINSGGGGSEPADKELYNRVKREAKEKFDVYPSAYANAWLVREYKKRGGKYKKKEVSKCLECGCNQPEESHGRTDVSTANIIMPSETPKFADADILKFDQKTFDTARQSLAELIAIEAKEMSEGGSEEVSLTHLLNAVHYLFAWYEGEKAEGEVMEESVEMAVKPEETIEEKSMTDKNHLMQGKDESYDDFCKRCMNKGETMEAFKERCKQYKEKMKSHHDKDKIEMSAESETEVAAEAEEVIPTEEVAAEVKEDAPTETVEEKISDESISTEEIEAIVEKAVKSATDSVRSEVALLLSAKEAAENKAATLEGQLATAKSLAVGGGPKRTLQPIDASNDLLTKALVYKQKANATTDPTLVKGYKALYEEYLAKSNNPDAK
jgi:hypothetical protein